MELAVPPVVWCEDENTRKRQKRHGVFPGVVHGVLSQSPVPQRLAGSGIHPIPMPDLEFHLSEPANDLVLLEDPTTYILLDWTVISYPQHIDNRRILQSVQRVP